MKKATLLFMLVLSTTTCFCQSFSRVWMTDSLFQKPESALFDSSKQVVYISNINGEYLAKDGNGFISKIKTNGEIESLKWVEGLDNPQGLGLYKSTLYVADINRVVQINTNTAIVEKVFEVDSAKFLNDVASDSNGDIYISDCFGNKVYRISNGKINVWLDSDFLSGPNGLMCTKDEVVLVNMKNKTAYAVNKTTKKHRIIFSGIDNLDGIVSDGRNGYFVSGAWQGEIFHVDADGNIKLIVDLGKEKVIAADIEYIINEKLLIIPTLDKTVIAYKMTNSIKF